MGAFPILYTLKFFEKILKKVLTNRKVCGIIKTLRERKQPERKGAHESK
jgi:hypothetical protein